MNQLGGPICAPDSGQKTDVRRSAAIALGPFLLLLCLLSAPCGADSAFSVSHQKADFDVYRLDQGEEHGLRFFWKRPEGSAYGSISALRDDLAARGEQLQFAINGGIYSKELRPLGLYVEHGAKLEGLSRGRGGGNFFLKPNGVFYITDQGAKVVETGHYRPVRKVLNAVQSGPMLVIDGELHPRFIPGYHSRYVRNGVGVDRAGRVVFAISDGPVNFHDFGTLFRDRLDCPNALYLDGKISQMYLPELGRYAWWSWRPFVSMIGLASRSPQDPDHNPDPIPDERP